MKREKIISFLIIIIAFVLFLYVYGYLKERGYQEKKVFFVNSCINTFYYDNGYGFNELVNDFTKELPIAIQDKIGREFLGWDGYVAYLDRENIENFCGHMFDFYQEDMEENTLDYCDEHICR